jgi:dihydrofolate reductase
MSTLRIDMTMSLDGYVAGPDQSLDDPLGKGGEALHEWMLATQSWRERHGQEGGEATVDDRYAAAWNENVGATIMGRNMFGPIRGSWQDDEWRGWWGEDPPYHTPVFVLTHHERAPLAMEGGTTFHFVTDGIESALAQAVAAADGKDVLIGGGASAAQQYLLSGLVDELTVHVVPVLLGRGERLFDHLDGGPVGLEPVELVASPAVAHFRYARAG